MKHYLIILLFLLTSGLFAQSTSWNEYKLKEHWKINGADEIEGIYENVVQEGTLSPKYTLAVIKKESSYLIVYLNMKGDMIEYVNGSYVNHKYKWSTGILKLI